MLKTILHAALLVLHCNNEATIARVVKLSSNEQSNSLESTNPSVSPTFSRDSFVTPSTLSNSKDDTDTPAPESSSLRQEFKFTLPNEESHRNLINDEDTNPRLLASTSCSETESLFEVKVQTDSYHPQFTRWELQDVKSSEMV